MFILDYFICRIFETLIPQPAGVGFQFDFRRESRKRESGTRPDCFAKGSSKKSSGSKTVYLASTPSVIEAASAPATETKADTTTAATDTLKKEAGKKGLASTLLAGETGGYDSAGKKTLLG